MPTTKLYNIPQQREICEFYANFLSSNIDTKVKAKNLDLDNIADQFLTTLSEDLMAAVRGVTREDLKTWLVEVFEISVRIVGNNLGSFSNAFDKKVIKKKKLPEVYQLIVGIGENNSSSVILDVGLHPATLIDVLIEEVFLEKKNSPDKTLSDICFKSKHLVKEIEALDILLQNIEWVADDSSPVLPTGKNGDGAFLDQLVEMKTILEDRPFSDQLAEFIKISEENPETFAQELRNTFYWVLPPEKLLLRASQFEAMNDIINGKLHRLDPVIRDAGCQWRIPFIIDLKKAMTRFETEGSQEIISAYERNTQPMGLNSMHWMGAQLKYESSLKVEEEKGDEKEGDTIPADRSVKIDEYVPKGNDNDWWLVRNTILLKMPAKNYTLKYNDFPFRHLKKYTTDEYLALFKEFSTAVNNLKLNDIFVFFDKNDGIIECEYGLLDDIWKDAGGLAPNCYRDNSKSGETEPMPQFELSTMDYLGMCKALTVRQIRCMDRFGLSSHSVPLNLPFMTETEMENYQVRLGIYSTKYLQKAFGLMIDAKSKAEIYKGGTPAQTQGLLDDLHNMQRQLSNAYYKITGARGPVISYYENKRLMYAYLFMRRTHIVLDVKRLEYTPTGAERRIRPKNLNRDKNGSPSEQAANIPVVASHKFNGGNVYLFVADTESGQFKCEVRPREDQLSVPALCVETYSMFTSAGEQNEECAGVTALSKLNMQNPADYEEFDKFIRNLDLIDMFLITTIYHSAFPNDTVLIGHDGLKADPELTEESLLSFSGAEDASIDGVAVERRPALPMFGNEFQGQPWNIKKEKAFIKANNKLTHYAAKSDLSDDKLITARAHITYPLGSIHLYACSYNDMREKFKNQEAMRQKHLGPDYGMPLSDVLDIVDCEKLIF